MIFCILLFSMLPFSTIRNCSLKLLNCISWPQMTTTLSQRDQYLSEACHYNAENAKLQNRTCLGLERMYRVRTSNSMSPNTTPAHRQTTPRATRYPLSTCSRTHLSSFPTFFPSLPHLITQFHTSVYKPQTPPDSPTQSSEHHQSSD